MDITGFITDRLFDDRVDDFNYRSVVAAVLDSANDRCERIFLQFVQTAAHTSADAVKIIDGIDDILLLGQDDGNIAAADHTHIVDSIKVSRVVHRYRQAVAILFQRH